jgi:hypothetical protein
VRYLSQPYFHLTKYKSHFVKQRTPSYISCPRKGNAENMRKLCNSRKHHSSLWLRWQYIPSFKLEQKIWKIFDEMCTYRMAVIIQNRNLVGLYFLFSSFKKISLSSCVNLTWQWSDITIKNKDLTISILRVGKDGVRCWTKCFSLYIFLKTLHEQGTKK